MWVAAPLTHPSAAAGAEPTGSGMARRALSHYGAATSKPGDRSLHLFAIASLLAAASLAVGIFALAKARSPELTPAAIEALTGDHTPLKSVRSAIALLGVLWVSGGLMLIAFSRWAAPLFILSTLLQTGYLLYASRVLPPDEGPQVLGRRRTIMAIYAQATATALVLWLESQGVLN